MLKTKRTVAQLMNHYRVEKALAAHLKIAPREERPRIYATMYDELFSRVPDHPRLVKRTDPITRGRRIRKAMRLVKHVVRPSTVFLEFGPGDCRFAFEVCKYVSKVYGVDISKQTGHFPEMPRNFEHVTYDGYQLPLPDASIDVIFSDQLIEHLHPDDVVLHFHLAKRILKPGGRYIFITPHRFTGPHDISRYFSEEAEGFHLKEWTYRELLEILRGVGYSSWKSYRLIKGVPTPMPCRLLLRLERMAESCDRSLRRRISRIFFPHIVIRTAK